jgi:zinc protease
MSSKKLLVLLLGLSAFSQIKLPPYSREVLPNGAVLILMPRQGLPLLNVRVTVKGGSESDPDELAGLARIGASMLERGTQKRNRAQLAEHLDFLGATLRTEVNRQSTSVQMEFLSKDQNQALDILEDVLLNSKFPEDEFKLVQAQTLDALKAGKENPQRAIGPYFRAFFFGPRHPNAHMETGDELSVAKLTRAAVMDYYRKMYVGKNVVAVVAGDFVPADLSAKMRKLLGAMPAGEPYQWKKDPGLQKPSGPRLLLVDKPDATQTYFYIGQAGIDRTNPDRTAIDLVNTLFGGSFTSMLNDALRVESGLTYGASSRVDKDRLTGSIAISTFTKTETTAQAIDLALAQLKKLGDQGISAAQLASAKAYVKGDYPTRALETADQLANVVTDFEIFDLNKGEVDDFISRIDAVTVEQANAIARKYYRLENLVFVLVGNAAKIRDLAGKYATGIKEVPLTKPGFP